MNACTDFEILRALGPAINVGVIIKAVKIVYTDLALLIPPAIGDSPASSRNYYNDHKYLQEMWLSVLV